MRRTNAKTVVEQKPLGVIDTLTAGFEIVRKRPWLMLLPILLDLALWILPRLSLSALLRPALDEVFDPRRMPPDSATNLDQMREAATQLVNSLDLLGMVASTLNSVARVPTLLTVDPVQVPSPITALAYTIQIQSGFMVLFLFLPLYLLGLLAAAMFLDAVAGGVLPLDPARQALTAWLPRVARLWLRLIGFSLVLALAVFGAGMALVFGQALMPSGEAASFIAALIAVGLFWIFFYLFFTLSALVLHQVGVWEALRRSVLLLRVQFWAALGLIILTLFLERGLSLIWLGLAVSPIGLVVGVAANAYIGASLVAATMVFYQDRMNWIEKWLKQKKSQTTSP